MGHMLSKAKQSRPVYLICNVNCLRKERKILASGFYNYSNYILK
jgi:hypothetical protein